MGGWGDEWGWAIGGQTNEWKDGWGMMGRCGWIDW